MSDRATPEAEAQYEALRARWERAKAGGTTAEFARELFEGGEPVPMPPASDFASPEEQASYEAARARFGPTDLLEILPYFFGDERGIPVEEVLADLGIDNLDDGAEGAPDDLR
jgi:hypothetical protein